MITVEHVEEATCTEDAMMDEQKIRQDVKKQIKKQPILKDVIYSPIGIFVYDGWHCPNCDARHEEVYEYCPSCGQAVDWSDEE